MYLQIDECDIKEIIKNYLNSSDCRVVFPHIDSFTGIKLIRDDIFDTIYAIVEFKNG